MSVTTPQEFLIKISDVGSAIDNIFAALNGSREELLRYVQYDCAEQLCVSIGINKVTLTDEHEEYIKKIFKQAGWSDVIIVVEDEVYITLYYNKVVI